MWSELVYLCLKSVLSKQHGNRQPSHTAEKKKKDPGTAHTVDRNRWVRKAVRPARQVPCFMEFVCFSCACVTFFQVLRLPRTVQRLECWVNWWLSFAHRCEWVSVYICQPLGYTGWLVLGWTVFIASRMYCIDLGQLFAERCGSSTKWAQIYNRNVYNIYFYSSSRNRSSVLFTYVPLNAVIWSCTEI